MELDIIRWLQDHFFQGMMYILSYAGHLFVVMGVAVVIYLIADKRLGGRMLIFYFTSMAFNAFLKEWIFRPRPFTKGANTIIERALQPSMPSGHAQGFASLMLPTALHFKNRRRAFILCGAALLFICFTRVYLGQHYPSDVLAGAAIGIAIAVGLELVYRFAKDKANLFLLALIPVFITLLIIFSDYRDAFVSCGMLTGCLVGMTVEERFVKYEVKGSLVNRLLKLGFSMLVTSVAIMPPALTYTFLPETASAGLSNFVLSLIFLFIGASFTLLCPFLITKVFNRKEKIAAKEAQ